MTEDPNFKSKYARVDMASEVLAKESDRGCVIFGAALAGESLERLIRSRLRDDEWTVRQIVNGLFRGFGPLATFSAQIEFSYAMRIISKDVYDLLTLLRKMRNTFAHKAGPTDFADERVVDHFSRFMELAGLSKATVEKLGHRICLGIVLAALEGHFDTSGGHEKPWIKLPP